MGKIKVAIIGVGNCASSLIQGIYYYQNKSEKDAIGLMNWDIAGYKPFDVEVVAAFDIDSRKIGKDINQAIFSNLGIGILGTVISWRKTSAVPTSSNRSMSVAFILNKIAGDPWRLPN